MDEQNGRERHHLSRRDFIRYSLATTVAVWAGSQIPRGALSEAEAQEVFGSARLAPGRFPQSVASGDPTPEGIVLWTRVLPPKRKRDESIRVGYRITSDDDPDFRNPVLSGVVRTSRRRDFTVKVQAPEGLASGTKYRYRFYYNGGHSKTGHFKTLPAADVSLDSLRFAYISCQDYTNGYYHALRFLAQEDIDFVVHLGDYIYETVGEESFQGGGPEERQFLFPKDSRRDDRREALSLRDYRFAYKKYRTDPYLQAVHENFAVIQIWDDHEFANDCHQVSAPDQGGTTEGDKRNPRRREAANQAWAEFTPAGIPYNPDKGPLDEIRIYRSFAFGDLLELVMTDERLYRDGPPNGNETQDRYLTPGAPEDGEGEEAPGRTMLGASQRDDYFLPQIRSNRTWKIWGNEVMFMQFKVANTYIDNGLFPDDPNFTPVAPDPNGEGIYVTLDQWDGYQYERFNITQAVKDPSIQNFVTITGDIHSYLAGYIKPDYDQLATAPGNAPVGVEFVCGSVTSSNLTELASFGRGRAPAPNGNEFTQAALASNPHFGYFNSDNHGYNLIEVRKDALFCTMVGLFTEDPQANGNPIRVPYERNELVQRTVIKDFKVNAGEGLIYTREEPAGPFVLLPPV